MRTLLFPKTAAHAFGGFARRISLCKKMGGCSTPFMHMPPLLYHPHPTVSAAQIFLFYVLSVTRLFPEQHRGAMRADVAMKRVRVSRAVFQADAEVRLVIAVPVKTSFPHQSR